MEIVAKDEAQSLADFAEGAAAARAWLGPRLYRSDDEDLTRCCGALLAAARDRGAFADGPAPTTVAAPPLVARVAFGVRASGVRRADLVPRSRGLVASFEALVQKWKFSPERDGPRLALREF